MATAKAGFPSQIKYIVGNEGCERYSYYGMRSILQYFMITYLLMESGHATEVMHLFMGACYLLPLLGSYIADRVWGRYQTILYLSFFYCAGHAVLAIFEGTEMGLYAGLALIALGSGGIKPCISAFVGDQFRADQKGLLNKVYDLFYFMINFGSFFSTIFTPLTLKYYGPSVAFGIPGILMFIATFIFWLGRKQYVKVPPTGADKDSFWSILTRGIFHNLQMGTKNTAIGWVGVALITAATGYGLMEWGLTGAFVVPLVLSVLIVAVGFKSFWSYAEKNHPPKRVEEFKIALGIARVFAAISVFWALFDQHASTWILQAEQMVRMTKIELFGYTLFEGEILSSQFSAINPIFVMIMIPVFTYGIYPAFEKIYPLTALRRMGWGFMVAAAGFATAAIIQYPIDGGAQVHIMWQTVQYLLMTAAEVMISITGLTFAYTQAPKSMKSTIMSFWLLTVFIGNLLTAFIVKLSIFPVGTGNFYMFFAGLIFLAGVLFALNVRNYKVRDIMEA
jgi:proton-dependent oligopeptide transporter, POT family